jgi:hypothetical protein
MSRFLIEESYSDSDDNSYFESCYESEVYNSKIDSKPSSFFNQKRFAYQEIPYKMGFKCLLRLKHHWKALEELDNDNSLILFGLSGKFQSFSTQFFYESPSISGDEDFLIESSIKISLNPKKNHLRYKSTSTQTNSEDSKNSKVILGRKLTEIPIISSTNFLSFSPNISPIISKRYLLDI